MNRRVHFLVDAVYWTMFYNSPIALASSPVLHAHYPLRLIGLFSTAIPNPVIYLLNAQVPSSPLWGDYRQRASELACRPKAVLERTRSLRSLALFVPRVQHTSTNALHFCPPLVVPIQLSRFLHVSSFIIDRLPLSFFPVCLQIDSHGLVQFRRFHLAARTFYLALQSL